MASNELKKVLREDQLASPATLHVALSLMNPMQLARAFTKIDAEIFASIALQDFSTLLIKGQTKRSGHLGRFVARFNRISKWVATEICMVYEMKKRGQLIEFFIKLTKAFKELGNYSSMMAIIGGLNVAAVMRLQQTWAVFSFASLH